MHAGTTNTQPVKVLIIVLTTIEAIIIITRIKSTEKLTSQQESEMNDGMLNRLCQMYKKNSVNNFFESTHTDATKSDAKSCVSGKSDSSS